MSSGRLGAVVRRDGLGRHERAGDPTPKNPRRRAVLGVDPASLRNSVEPKPVAEKILPKNPRRRRLPSPLIGDAPNCSIPNQKWRKRAREIALEATRFEELVRHQQGLTRKANQDTPTENVPTKIRQPRTEQVCTHRRRAYVKHALRCLYGRKRKPKYVPSWWRDESLRQAAIAAAFA